MFFPNSDETITGGIWQRFEEHAVDNRKGRRGGANTEGKSDQCGRRERWPLPKHADAIAQVLAQIGEPGDRITVACLFRCERHPPEPIAGLVPCGFWRHSLPNELVSALLKMEANFIVDVFRGP